MVVEAIRHLLNRSDEFNVAATTDNGDDLLSFLKNQSFDVALIDVSMPGPGIHEIAQLVRGLKNPPKLIALTMHLDPTLSHVLLDTGFSGYVIKDAAFDELMIAIRTVMEGRQYISKAVKKLQGKQSQGHHLTPREFDCLLAACEGFSNKKISRQLGITERTVKFHFENIFRKLKATNRGEAIAIARRENWI